VRQIALRAWLDSESDYRLTEQKAEVSRKFLVVMQIDRP
jgi:hypothetical protein